MATELTEYGKLLESFRKREEGARLSNLARKDQVSQIYQDIIKRYEPGGAFGAGYEAQLQRQKIGDVGKTAQRDIGRGLYGIRPYEQEWEATTGASARLKLEDLRMERLSGAQTGMAGFLERIEEPYPDYSALMAASQAQGQGYSPQRAAPTGGGGYSTPGWGEHPIMGSANRQNIADFMGGGGYSGGGSTAATTQGSAPQLGITHQALPAQGGRTGGVPSEEPMGSLQESVFAEKPPAWTGNYRSWKKKMDEYNRKHGKPTTGY